MLRLAMQQHRADRFAGHLIRCETWHLLLANPCVQTQAQQVLRPGTVTKDLGQPLRRGLGLQVKTT
ncbi:hypothetical protein D3C73_1468190 [compost metagenome]